MSDGHEFYGVKKQEEKISWRDLIFEQIQRILKIDSDELRNQEKLFFISTGQINDPSFVSVVDTRVSYFQAVMDLAYLLLPHFDDQITKVYSRCQYLSQIKKIHFVSSYIDKYPDEYKEFLDEGSIPKKLSAEIFNSAKEMRARKLFAECMLLISRNDFLEKEIKPSVFEE